MHYLIDGCNYLKRADLFGSVSFEVQRAALARRVGGLARPSDRVTIFWDARRSRSFGPQEGGAYDVPRKVAAVFCRGREGADGAILAAVRSADDPPEQCVVSDDREISGLARQHGAATLSVAEAERRLFPGSAGPPPRGARRGGVPPRQARDADRDDDAPDEKPAPPSKGCAGPWLDYFGATEEERQ